MNRIVVDLLNVARALIAKPFMTAEERIGVLMECERVLLRARDGVIKLRRIVQQREKRGRV